MKFCTTCGAQLSDTASFCTSCGTAVSAPVNRNISRDEYIKNHAEPKLAKELKTCAIICYVLLAINLAVAIFVNWFSLIDVVIYGALTLGMHLKKSKGCAIALLVVSVASTVINLVLTGSFTGWLWIIVSISTVVTFTKIDKAYEAFKAGATPHPADMTQ